MNYMKSKDNHIDQDQFIEYFYEESPNSREIEDHLRVCQRCHERYLDLKRDMQSISDHFKHDFWRIQQRRIMSKISQIQESKTALWVRFLKPAFIGAVLIILFGGIYFGIYFRSHDASRMYTENDRIEEIFLEKVSQLVNQPLTTSLDYLDFQEEDTEETEFPEYLEDLEILAYWPDLEV
ncbi:MAG: hypothetical protein ACMUJM_01950 [bacterium]